MAYAGRKTALEDRRVRWLPFDEAIEGLDRGKSRRVLRSADRLISLATGREPRRHRFGRAAAHLAEWLVLGAFALLFVIPLPPAAAALLVLPAGIFVSFAMRALLRPLAGLASADDDVVLPAGDRRLRFLVGGEQWLTRTGYLGGPIRIAAALAVLAPAIPASGEWWVVPAGLALAATVSWFMTRKGRRPPRSIGALLGAPALWLALALAGYSLFTTGGVLPVLAALPVSATAAIVWWRLERRRAAVYAAVGGSRG